MAEKLLINYGNVIRKQRLHKNLSQEDLADLCALHRTYISDVELGKRNISLANIGKIAAALGISLSELFYEMENTNEKI